ncbi:MAG: hypothetical protein IJU00_00840 [Selenomonas sp.]|nr:hypothetical protein [Selenomonas sp.]
MFPLLKNKLNKIEKMTFLNRVFNDILDNNTINEIKSGTVFVSEQTINEELKEHIQQEKNFLVRRMNITSHDNRLDIFVEFEGKSIHLSGKLEKFICNSKEAKFIYVVSDHKFEGGGISSWIFSKLTLSFMHKFIGEDKIPENIDVIVNGNVIEVDFLRWINASKLGKRNIGGVKVFDVLKIENAMPKEGGVEIKVSLENLKQVVMDFGKRGN